MKITIEGDHNEIMELLKEIRKPRYTSPYITLTDGASIKTTWTPSKHDSVTYSTICDIVAPKAKWVFEEGGYRCSRCKADYFRVDGMKFCPKCGAKMEIEK